MLKIQATRQTGAEVTVALIGTVQREYLPELEGVVRQAAQTAAASRSTSRRCASWTATAVAFLAAAVERQVRLVGCPAYLREWLRSEARGPQAGQPAHRTHACAHEDIA